MANLPQVIALSLLVSTFAACTHLRRETEQPLSASQAQALRAGESAEVTGRLRTIIGDDFARKQSKSICQITEDQTGKVYDLKLASSADLRNCRGSAKVTGRRTASANQLDQIRIEASASAAETASAAPPVAGTFNTLVIIADFQNASVSCSRQDINEHMFGTNNSVAALYREITGNQLRIQGQVVGPYRISARVPVVGCPWLDWDAEARALAEADGVNVAMYDKIMYIYGGYGDCPGVGWAYLGGRDMSLVGGYCTNKQTMAHEYGHSLGMHHAARVDTPSHQYGDISDIMGLTPSLRQVNGAHRAAMGWTAPQKLQTVTTSGIYRLSPLQVDASAAAHLQTIRIAKPDSGEDYWLSYRQPIGFDVALRDIPYYGNQYIEGLSIVRYRAGTSDLTYHVVALNDRPDGRVFIDAANRIRITQLAHDANGVTFEVSFNGETTTDTQSPVASILYPAAGATVSGYVPISVSASDDSGVAKVEFYVDGALKGTVASAPFTYDWDASDISLVGMHTIQAKAYDAAGNVGSSGAHTVRVVAAPVTLAGRVVAPNGGTSLSGARVTVTDLGTGAAYLATTSSFGNFSLQAPVRAKPVIITVMSKRYRFAPKTLTPAADVSNLLFVALE